MAGENIKTVTPVFSEKIGARILAVAELTVPTKYLTEGCEIPLTQLQECGLTVGQVDAGIVLNTGVAAKNAESFTAQFNITNPSATPYPKAEAQKVKLQLYESITTAANKEIASESEKFKAAIVLVLLIGR
jgi:hypothetical protein